MSHFIIRAELHKPYPTDIYERLHAVMLQSNYFRIIQSSEGAFYNLPPAEYLTTRRRRTPQTKSSTAYGRSSLRFIPIPKFSYRNWFLGLRGA